MQETPHNLTIQQQQLLLYLAGELPAEQTRAIDRRLTTDSALRTELESLRQADAMLNQGLHAADAAEPIDHRVRSVERRMTQLLAQWQVDRVTRKPASADARRPRRVPVWLYPLTAAATVMVGLGIWSLTLRDEPAPPVVQVPIDVIPDWMLAAVQDSESDEVAAAVLEPDPVATIERQYTRFRAVDDLFQ